MSGSKGVTLGGDNAALLLQQQRLEEERAAQTGQVKKTGGASQVLDTDQIGGSEHRLLRGKARDTGGAKQIGMLETFLRKGVDMVADAALGVSNFLRKFGSGEENPKLYPNLLAPPRTDTPFDEVTVALKGNQIEGLGELMRIVSDAHLKGVLDVKSGDQQAIQGLLIANNMGLMTDALKVKMVGWNLQTEQLANGTVSFEMGIRAMPKGMDTNYYVAGGINECVEWVKNLRISPQAVEWMKGHALFKNYPKEFFAYFMPPTDAKGGRIPGGLSKFEEDLKKVKIDALMDGEIYPGGPMMRVSGPPAAVEFIESNLMRLVTSWTTVATAASQMTVGADGKPVAYFGVRRAPGGGDETLAISDAAALGGMTVTSDLMAGFFGSAITGTMEHSIMMMLKTVFKHDPPREFTAQERKWAEDFLTATWKADNPNISDADLKAKLKAQVEDVLVEAYVFKEYGFKNDKEKAVALIDTSHPNIGTAAAMVAQQMLWAEQGKSPETTLNAIRLDSGVLLAQGLQFRRVLNAAGMESTKIMATDGLLPETVKFFEQVEKELRASSGGKPSAKFYEMMKNAPESVAEDDNERKQIIAMAEQLVANGGIKGGQALFAGYGAGEKIADSVSTVGRPGIVYKAAQLNFTSKTTGEEVSVPLGKIPNPSKATGPERELFAVMGNDGKIAQYVIGTPAEVEHAGGKVQRLMRTVLENGESRVNTSHQAAVKYGAARRELMPEALKEGEKAPLGMTAAYKEAWLDVVRKADPTRVEEFRTYIDKTWPTVEL